MLRECAALWNAPACAERIAVRPRPRIATATSTSRRVKPRLSDLTIISEPRVRALGLLAVVARPRHVELAFAHLRLARERRDEDGQHVHVELRSRDAELDRG